MVKTLTLNESPLRRILSAVFGLGMMAASFMTIQHFFLANYPESIFEGSFCDISAFFNCDSSAFSNISAVFGIPIGLFGFIIGCLVVMGALFPSEKFEKTNAFISLINLLGVISLFSYTVFFLKSLCLLCTGYYIFSILSFVLYWKYSIGRRQLGYFGRFFRPSFKMLVTFAVITAILSYGMIEYHNARKAGQPDIAIKIVRQFFELPIVGNPSFISPYWTAQSTDLFEDAPIQIIAYSDFTCPDCLFLNNQLTVLKQEFAGKINIAFQFFPLEGACNSVVAKDIHPGACDLSYIAVVTGVDDQSVVVQILS
ncbi:vitamin K epoxide reductase family protein, partial [Acidobacteriota bacterium]